MANAHVRGRPIARLVLSAQERAYLERQVRRHRVARSLSERCRVILRCADGGASKEVAAELGLHEHTVGKWRRRFLKDRCEGLLEEARPGRPRSIGDDQVAAVIERTLRSTPVDATHWSIRSMAAETGFSHTTIRVGWGASASFVSDGAAARFLIGASVASPAIAAPWRTSRRKKPVVLFSLIYSSGWRTNARHGSKVHPVRAKFRRWARARASRARWRRPRVREELQDRLSTGHRDRRARHVA